MILFIWHTSFTVADLGRSIRFYRDVLGLEVVHQQEQANEYTRTFVGYSDAHLRVAQFAIPGAQIPRSRHVIELVQHVTPEGKTVHPDRYQPGAATSPSRSATHERSMSAWLGRACTSFPSRWLSQPA